MAEISLTRISFHSTNTRKNKARSGSTYEALYFFPWQTFHDDSCYVKFEIEEVLNSILALSTVGGERCQLGLTDQFGLFQKKKKRKDFFRVTIKFISNFEFKLATCMHNSIFFSLFIQIDIAARRLN